MDVAVLLEDLRSDDWRNAVRAAKRLGQVAGESVTEALLQALDAGDTAVTDAAAYSLGFRNASCTAERMWQALLTLDDDVTEQIWSVVSRLAGEPVSLELERRYEAQ